MEKNSGWVLGDAPGEHPCGWLLERGKQQQHPELSVPAADTEQNGKVCDGGEGNPSSDQLSAVSHSFLRVFQPVSCLFPAVSMRLEPNRLGGCKWILPSGHLNLPLLWAQKVPGAAELPTLAQPRPAPGGTAWNGTNTVEGVILSCQGRIDEN